MKLINAPGSTAGGRHSSAGVLASAWRAASTWAMAVAMLALLGASHLTQAQPTAQATFAGGCFWCVEADFDKVPGVLSTTSGYIGGSVANPTYEQVSAKATGHAEAVQITYDPAKVTYEQLLDKFWRSIDPTTRDRQFCDVGSPYRTAIFAHDDRQLEAARRSLQALEKSKPFAAPIVTEIQRAGPFYPAEAYHQDYHQKNPLRYQFYRQRCGRDARLQELWGKASP